MLFLGLKFIFIVNLTFPLFGIAINFNNNACTSIEAYHNWFRSEKCYYNPDVLSNVPSIANRHGYKTEIHSVITEDGYILTLFRISSKKAKAHQSPVFIHHGITANSALWVDIGDRSLAFNLADLGYDVWLANARGTTYSQKHRNLTVADPKYWEFSLDTIATIDLPKQLNFIANKTGNKGDIIYIGHSMGTTLAFMYCSEFYQEAQSLLQGLITLAPVVYLNHTTIGGPIMSLFFPVLDFLEAQQIKGLFYQEEIIHQFLTFVCKLLPEACYGVLNVLFGRTAQFAARDLLIVFSYWPTGTSIYPLRQYLQIAKSTRFQKYDYGEKKNMEKYGTSKPPTYNLNNINIPIHLYYGTRDNLYDKKDFNRLFSEIGSNRKFKHKTPSEDNGNDFNHNDFVYSKYLKKYLYDDMFKVLSTDFTCKSCKENP